MSAPLSPTSRIVDAHTAAVFGALLGIVLILGMATYLSPNLYDVLRYERNAVSHGEVWRLISAHLVHADPQHMMLNVLGTAVIAALFPHSYGIREWLTIIAISVTAVDFGLLLFDPQLDWYVGLSGVLHGLLVAGALAWWRENARHWALLLGAVLIGKLAWEQWHGALPLASGVAVIVNAHLYGAVGGAFGGLLTGRPRHQTNSSASL